MSVARSGMDLTVPWLGQPNRMVCSKVLSGRDVVSGTASGTLIDLQRAWGFHARLGKAQQELAGTTWEDACSSWVGSAAAKPARRW